ncbi:alpha/beta hydrolase [Brachybacterium sp. AOP43-C2-M15]|uniref:alpha/beta hydrolase n=1 Tax=Brachybacterium sp. AOP43-C2-M15 TaxID=3457661 RepID=UPI0040341D6A
MSALSAPTTLIEDGFDAESVAQRVDHRVLLPADRSPGERLPLVLHLHGALSSAASLELHRPLYDELTVSGGLPRAIIACVSTPTVGGFYIDRPGAAWESLVAREYPAHLEERFGPLGETALIGSSMGGYGALAIAVADPERFAAVAAISPAVFPAEAPAEVPARNIPSVLGDLHSAMSGGTGDLSVYAENDVHARARRRAAVIRASSLRILIDCGAADEFLLHEGAAHLHGVLEELGIEHGFRLVDGAGHMDDPAVTRSRDAIAFLGRALAAT